MTDREMIRALRKTAMVITAETIAWDDLKIAAADRLEALLAENEHLREATKMVPQWVSVEERLPEEYRDEYREPKCFLVCVENCREPFRALYDGKHWGDGWNVLDVTHWMPLPEPPSTEGVE